MAQELKRRVRPNMMQRVWDRRKSDEGFTLIELLVVIVILGILSAVVVFAVGGISDKGTASACKADVSSVATASEAYYAKTGAYAAGNDAVGIGVLVTAKLIRSAPSTTNGYTITYTASDGSVSSTPACSTL
jgi:general secretion pathway protein G